MFTSAIVGKIDEHQTLRYEVSFATITAVFAIYGLKSTTTQEERKQQTNAFKRWNCDCSVRTTQLIRSFSQSHLKLCYFLSNASVFANVDLQCRIVELWRMVVNIFEGDVHCGKNFFVAATILRCYNLQPHKVYRTNSEQRKTNWDLNLSKLIFGSKDRNNEINKTDVSPVTPLKY